jgi:hypothetical protein
MTACSNIHPGSAAVVDGVSISMSRADDAAAAYCQLSLATAAQQGVTDVPSAAARRQAITDLIMSAVAEKVAKDRNLAVDPGSYVLTEKQSRQIAAAFPHADDKQIADAIERSQRTYAIAVALGEAVSGRQVTEKSTESEQSAVQTAGQDVITKAYQKSDISIDPRFGLDDLTKQVAQTGSLSIPQSDKAVDPATLPPSQRCS